MINPSMGDVFVWFEGVVEDINDPLKLGRVRVRAIGFHTPEKVELPTDCLPWASVLMPVSSASVNGIGHSPSGLVCGAWVIGFFRDGHAAQDPIIMGTLAGIPIVKANSAQGFNDPNEQYPKVDYLNEPDVNRLARNESISETIVQTKNDAREIGVATAGGGSWNEPESPYDAKYPYNHVMETESGHVQEFDDTPGAERIHQYHKSGTYHEIGPDGQKVTKVVSDKYTVILGNDKIVIKKNADKTIEGNSNNLIKGNLTIEVLGNVDINVVGETNVVTESDANVAVGGSMNVAVAGSLTVVAEGAATINANSTCAVTSTGKTDVHVKGSSTMQTDGEHFHKIRGKCAIVSDTEILFLAPTVHSNPDGVSLSDYPDPL